MPDKCLVLGCASRREREKVSFYRVPVVSSSVYFPHVNELSRNRRLAWLAAIKRSDLTQSKVANQRVCSKHFITGKPSKLEEVDHPDWAPSQHMMGHQGPRTLKTKTVPDKKKRNDKRLKTEKLENDSDLEAPDNLSLEDENEETSIPGTSTQTDSTFKDISALISHQDFAVEKINKLQSNVEVQTSYFGLMEDTKNIAKWTYYTGFQHDTVQSIYEENVKKCIPSTSTTSLSPLNQLLLTLIKLRLNLHFEDLGFRFNITPTTASTYFENIVNTLYESFKSLIVWPDSSLNRNIPLCFKELFHEKTTVIINCFEVFIEKPEKLTIQKQCWSEYRQHHTIKFLIGMTPVGTICYISKAFSGQTSDKQMVERSDFLNHITPGDVILADGSFQIDDKKRIQGAKLIPAFIKRKNQLQPLEITSTRNIAHVKIHVERAIGMLKNNFTIFKGIVPMSRIKTDLEENNILTQMIVICCALININPPVIPM